MGRFNPRPNLVSQVRFLPGASSRGDEHLEELAFEVRLGTAEARGDQALTWVWASTREGG